MTRVKAEHVALLILAALGVLFLAGGLRKAGGLPVPATTTEDVARVPAPVQAVLCMPDEHVGQMVFTKHRYPAQVGGELSTVIHYGHSKLAVPNVNDLNWIVSPPSEMGP